MTVTGDRVERATAAEVARFVASHPRSEAAARDAAALFGGVPMPWMRRWPGPFPIVAASAVGARVVDIDGIEYADLCLGDTGAMTGHAPAPVVAAVAEQAARGITTMLPARGRGRRRGPAARALRPRALAVHAQRDGRQPHRDPLRPPPHRPPEDPRLRRVLPRRRSTRRSRSPDRTGGGRSARVASARRSTSRRPRASSPSTTRPRWKRRSRTATSRRCWPSRR